MTISPYQPSRLKRLVGLILDRPRAYRFWSFGIDGQKKRILLTLLKGWSGERVLDVGCGIGNNADLFEKLDYTGIDVNEAYVQMAKTWHPNQEFIVADATRAFPPGRFDLVVINSLLHHLGDSGVLAVLTNALGALTRDGTIVLLEPEVPPDGARLPRILMTLDRGGYFRSHEGWTALSRAAGLRVLREHRGTLTVCGITAWYLLAAELGP